MLPTVAYGGFKPFIQYQATTDGRYIQNLYNSYDFKNNVSNTNLIQSAVELTQDQKQQSVKEYNGDIDPGKLTFAKY